MAKDAEGIQEGQTDRREKAGDDAPAGGGDRRDVLAADRTVFAAERTYSAWVRTGLAALASGIGVRTLLAKVLPDWLAIIIGSILILFSGFCFAAAIWREFKPGASLPKADTPSIPAVVLIVMNGLLLIAALGALYGIWTGVP